MFQYKISYSSKIAGVSLTKRGLSFHKDVNRVIQFYTDNNFVFSTGKKLAFWELEEAGLKNVQGVFSLIFNR
jgi:hypothetical protein